VSDNSAGSNPGGGIFNANSATLHLYSATVAGNSASTGGGIRAGGTVTLVDTLLAANTASSTGPDCAGTLSSSGYNLVGDGTGCTGLTDGANGDKVGTASAPIDPLLGPLAGNGGPTRTRAILPGSPAIAAGSYSCADDGGHALATDQRGVARPDPSSRCDIGAYQSRTLSVAPAPTGADSATCGAAGSPCATIRQALANGSSGDTVSVAAGAYTERLDISKSIALQGVGAGQTVVDGSSGGAVLTVEKGAVVGVSGVTIQHGKAPSGGGVVNSGTLTLRADAVTSSTADSNGGGIDNRGTLALVDSTVSAGSAGGNGGGVYNENHGTLTIMGTTLSGNTATGDGAGLFVRDGTATLVDSTVSGNTTTGGRGGAIANGGTLGLYSVTVSGNSASTAGGIYANGGSASLAGTILAGNTASGTDPDCRGPLTSGGYNLLGDNAGCTGLTNGANGDKVGTARAPIDPLLRPLAGNGGPTRTMAPLPGSPAVDAVGAGGCKDAQGVALTTDQRGLVRPDPTSGRCDIGAYETHTLFVATAANGGDDGHDCLLATRACATVAAALRKASAGDTVSLDTGTYTETVDLATSVTLRGAGAGQTVLDGADRDSVVRVRQGVVARVVGITIQHGHASNGGGVNVDGTLTLADSEVISNTATTGAGIRAQGPALTLSGSTVAHNTASGDAGGIAVDKGLTTLSNSSLISNTAAGNGNGGGLRIAPGSTAVLSGTTLAGDAAGRDGGGVENAGALTTINSTLNGNTAGAGRRGGAIHNVGALRLYNATVDGNAAGNGGGIYAESGGAAAISDTILAGNTILGTGGAGPDCAGLLSSGGYNILGDAAGCTLTGGSGDQVGGGANPVLDPRLYPLGNYGGPTLTMALRRDSPAIEAGDPNGCADKDANPLTTDQRGSPRPFPVGGRCDIGAYEYQSLLPTATPTSPPADTATATATDTPTDTPAPTNTLVPTATRPPTHTPTPTATPTAADTATPTSTATDSPAPTSTASPSGTATATGTATGTPTASSTATTGPTSTATDTPNAGACLQEHLGGWYFESTDCSSNPGHASNVRAVAPGGLTLESAIPLLTLPGSSSGGRFTLDTPVQLPDLKVSLPASGPAFTLAASGASVDGNGLSVATAALALPSVFGGYTLTGHNLLFGTDGSLGGQISVGPDPLTFALGQLGVSASGVTIDRGGVGVDTITVTLPQALVPTGSSNTLTGHNIRLNSDGTFGGTLTLPDTSFAVAGFTVGVHDITLSTAGLAIGRADATLPTTLTGGATVTVAGTNLSLGTDGSVGGTLGIAGPLSVSVAGFTAAASDIVLDRTGLSVGSISLTLPSTFGGRSLVASNVSIDTSGHVSGTVTIPPPPLHFSLGVLGVDVDGLTLDRGGIAASAITATLPAALVPSGVGNALVGHDIRLNSDGTFGGNIALPDVDVTLAGFKVGIHGLTLSTDGIAIDHADATVTLPGNGPLRLSGQYLTINRGGSVDGALVVSGLSLTLAGFTVQTTDILLDKTGLRVDHLALSTPAVFNLPAIDVTNVYVGTDGTISGTVSIPLTLSFHIGGFTFSGSNVSLSQQGVEIGSLGLTLPSALGGRTLTGCNIYVNFDGTFGGSPTGCGGSPNSMAAAPGMSPAPGVVARERLAALAGSVAPAISHLPAVLSDGSVTVAGFTVSVHGLALSPRSVSVASASATLPAALTPGSGSPISLTGANLSLGADGVFTGSLTVSVPQLSVDGFTATAGPITLDRGGLTLTTISVTLPSVFGGAGLAGTDIHVAPDGTVSGSIAVMPRTINFSLGAFTLSATGLALSRAGVSVDALSITLPSGATLAAHDIALHADGTFGGNISLPDTTFSVAGFDVSISGLALSTAGITITSALATVVPPSGAPIDLTGSNLYLRRDGQFGGSLSVAAPSLSLGGFTLGADAITLSRDGLVVSNASLALPSSLFRSGDLAPTLRGSLSISPNFAIQGSLSTGPIAINEGGFSLATDGVTLDNNGLRITNASLSLPADLFPAGVTPPTFRGSLSVSSHFVITGQLVATGAKLQYAGFTLSVGQFVLDQDGVAVNGVSLTLPGLNADGGDLTLTGALSIKKDMSGKFVVDGYISIPNISVSAYGFGVAATNVRLGTEGLSIGTATLDLAGLGLGNHTLSISGLKVSPSFVVSGGVVGVDGSSTLTLSLDGASVSLSNLTIGSVGISAGTIALTLPDVLGSKTFTMNKLTIGRSGEVSGTVTGSNGGKLSLSLADFTVAASSITFDSKTGVTVTNVALGLPIFQGTISVGSIGYDGRSVSLSGLPPLPTDFTIPGISAGQTVASIKADCKAGGGTFLPLPPLSAGGFSISGSGCLSFGTDESGHKTYDIVGRGSVSLAKIGNLNALVEIGSVDDFGHPSPLRHAALDVQIAGAGLPIDETGLEINGINGEIYIAGQRGAPTYTFQVGLDFQTDDGGYLFHGTAHATFSSDGNFGIGGSGTFFSFLPIAGGFCVRLVAPTFVNGNGATQRLNDHVCSNTLTHHGPAVDASSGTGFYAEISSDFSIHINKDISFHADAYGHIWVDGDGPELAASADLSLNIPESAFLWEVPPCGIYVGAGFQIGKFSHGGDRIRGFKGSLDLDICSAFNLSEDIFVDDSGNVHTNQGSNYTLIDASNGTSYLLARAGNGQVAVRRIQGLASPKAPGETDVPVTVAPGQTATLFNLTWRRGAPTLRLTAPDGTVYTRDQLGVGNKLYVASNGQGLPAGYTGGEMLYLPKPQPGIWHVTVGNLHGDEGYRLVAQGKAPRPSLAVTVPAAGQTLRADPTAELAGTLGEPVADNGQQTVSLYYTTSPTTVIDGKTMPNYAGTLIASGVPVRNGAWRYSWDAGAVPAGAYYVYATLDNGAGAAINGFAPGTVQVVQQVRPDAPRDVVGAQTTGQLALMWAPPARAGVVGGYRVHWRTSAMPAGAYYTIDAGEAHSYILNETQTGVTYEATISDYDLSDHESAATPAHVPSVFEAVGQGALAGPRPADFRLVAGQASTVAGGFTHIPLSVQAATGAATGGAADYVTLGVSAPAGILARPALGDLDIFAHDAHGASVSSALSVFTRTDLKPGLYPLVVTARQGLTGRVRTARATLIVRPGAASVVTMQSGRATKRADGLMSVPVVARVSDRSGSAVGDGASVTFSAPEGALQPGVVTTRGGVARTTLLYVPGTGTPPVVTADASTALGTLYLGPIPAGASRERWFAAGSGRPALKGTRSTPASPAVSENLALRNPLPVQAHVRVLVYTAPTPGAAGQARVITIPLGPNGTVVERFGALGLGYPLIGVDVQSDTPVIATRVARRILTHGKTSVLGTTRGLGAPHRVYRYTLTGARTTIDLYNPGAAPARVTLSATGQGRSSKSIRLTLAAHDSARADVGSPVKPGGVRAPGALVVSVVADRAVVVEVDPTPALPAGARPAFSSCIGVRGPLPTCARHHVGPS